RILLKYLTVADAKDVLMWTGRYIEGNLGRMSGLVAVLEAPGSGEARAASWRDPLAEVTQEILRALGGAYARLARAMARPIASDEEPRATDALTEQEALLVEEMVLGFGSADLDPEALRVVRDKALDLHQAVRKWTEHIPQNVPYVDLLFAFALGKLGDPTQG